MKISRRRYEKKMWKALEEGQKRGRQEMADMICDCLGKIRTKVTGNPAAYNGLLHAQATVEGFRLLAYFYDETPVKDSIALSQRFFDSRRQDSLIVYREALLENYSRLSAPALTGDTNVAA